MVFMIQKRMWGCAAEWGAVGRCTMKAGGTPARREAGGRGRLLDCRGLWLGTHSGGAHRILARARGQWKDFSLSGFDSRASDGGGGRIAVALPRAETGDFSTGTGTVGGR